VSSWMSDSIITAERFTTIHDAQRIMRNHQIRSLPVTNNGEIIGMITLRDLCRADASNLQKNDWDDYRIISRKTVSEIMTKNVLTIQEETNIAKAAQIMQENKVSSLPVLNKTKNFVGIVTTTDVLSFLIDSLSNNHGNFIVEQYMSRDLILISNKCSLLEAHRLMGTKRVDTLPIIDENKVVGIVTKTDLFAADPSVFTSINNQNCSKMIQQAPVEYIMTCNPETINQKERIISAAKKFIDLKIHSLPVVDEEERIVGIISETDLFKLVINKYL